MTNLPTPRTPDPSPLPGGSVPGPRRPVLLPVFRIELALDEGAGTRLVAGLPPIEDVPPGYAPSIGLWLQGSPDVDMDTETFDTFLADLDVFREQLRALRLVMKPVWPTRS